MLLSDMPGHLIRRLNQQSTSVFQDQMKAHGHDLTSVQFAALSILAQNPGLDQATLAKLIAYDRATIGDVVKRLLEKQYIVRQTNKEDRRARNLWLSPAGQSLLDTISPLVTALQTDILANLNEDEQSTLIGLIKKALPAPSKPSPEG